MTTTTTPPAVHERSDGGGVTLCGRPVYMHSPLAGTPDEVTCKNCLRVRKSLASYQQTVALAQDARWAALRAHITGERAAQDQLAADHGELGHRDQEERAYGRVEALDGLLATMDRMEAGQ